MNKRWVKILVAVIAVIVVAIVSVPFLINADTFRPRIEQQLSAALGRGVTLGHLSFSLLRGSLVAENITIADDPAYSSSPFLQAKSLYIGVETGPLLFHHELHITRFAVDAPAIHLIQSENGKWNFSSIGGASKASSSQPAAIPNFTVGEFSIEDGTATVSSLPAVGKPFVYSGINLNVQHLAFASSFPFDLTAKLPADGTLKLAGNAGPLAQSDASRTPFQATLELKHFDPVAAGVIERGNGISMIVDLNSKLDSDGGTVSSSGKIQAAQLQLARTGSPAPRPVDIDYAISSNLATRTGRVSDIAIHSGSVAAHVTGGFRQTAQAVLLDLHLAAPNLPIDQLVTMLPAAGVTLPSGSSLRGGTLSATLDISGPATATTITGPVEVDNTELVGFDLLSKIQGMKLLGQSGPGGGTNIQTLRTVVNSGPQITQFSNIYASVPSVGTASGSGTVSPSGDLDFNLVAKFNSSSVVGNVANQAVNAVSGLVSGFLHPKAKPSTTQASDRGIPLTIKGTASKPSIRANVGAMLR